MIFCKAVIPGNEDVDEDHESIIIEANDISDGCLGLDKSKGGS